MIEKAIEQLIAGNPGKHYIIEKPSGQRYCLIDPDGEMWDAGALAGMLSPEPEMEEWEVAGDTATCTTHAGHSYKIIFGTEAEAEAKVALVEAAAERAAAVEAAIAAEAEAVAAEAAAAEERAAKVAAAVAAKAEAEAKAAEVAAAAETEEAAD